jgi:hypothetical protein
LAVIVLAGCSAADSATRSPNSAEPAKPRAAPLERGMPAAKPCGDSEIERSTCMIELILADLKANYHHIGGGITSIKAGTSMSYSVALPQEERTDILTYEFELRGRAVAIRSKKEATESY